MKFIFDTLKQLRHNAWKAVEVYHAAQLEIIPQGFNNNISWNLGHMIASQQILCYKMNGQEPLVPENFLSLYRKGTSPRDWTKPADLEELKHYFALTTEALYRDFENSKGSVYQAYTTSAGITLTTLEEAMLYNYGHENLHYGVILSIRKLI